MKTVTISGTLDSGKTTLIRELITRMTARGKRCAVIVNERGEIDYDDPFIETHELTVERLRGG